jgi:PAS domain S-box-containing protein
MVQKLKEDNFDLIISDILMPEMDGFQLCRKVKTNPRLQKIAFIIYTATYTGPKDEEFALKIGADRFVIKPCEPEKLLNIIEEVMSNISARKPLTQQEKLPEEEILKLYNERLIRKLEKKVEEYKKELKERNKVEHDLIASEARYRRLFEAARDGILILDAETGIIQDVNPYLIEMMGLSRKEFCGKMLWELGFFEDIAFNKANLIELQKKKYIRYEDLPLKTADGRILDVEFISNVYLVGNQKVIQCNIRNITERKKTEDELKTNYTLLQIAGETAHFGGWSVDLQNNICTWSDAVADIHEMPHGFAPKIEEGISFYAPEWCDKITQVFSACAEKGIPYDEEMEIITKTGKRVWVRTIGRAVKNEKDEIIRVEGTFQDISESKQKQIALQESEDRLSKIMLAANDGMWDWNLRTNEVYFDPRYYTMAGFKVDEFPHRLEEFQKRIHPEDIDYVMTQAEKHLKGEIERFQVEFRFRKKTGDWLWVAGRGIIVERDKKGIPLRFVGTHQDITQRKKAEAELRRMKDELELQVTEKTRELQERVAELERFHDATIEREFRMKELRDEIERLKRDKK